MPEIKINNKEYVLPEGITIIGRSKDADICIDSTKLSRVHARFIIQGTTISIEDLGSSNGTFVNGTRIEGKKELAQGDRVKLADIPCEIKYPQAAPVPLKPARQTPPSSLKAADKRSRRKQKETIKKVVVIAVLVIIGLSVFSYIKNYVSEEQKKSRITIHNADTTLSAFELSQDINTNFELRNNFEQIKKQLSQIPSRYAEEHKEADRIISKINEALEKIDTKNRILQIEKDALALLTGIEESYQGGALSFEEAISTLENLKISYPDTQAAEKAAEIIIAITGQREEKERKTIADAKTKAESLAGSGDFKDALALLNDCLTKEFLRIPKHEIDSLSELKTRIIRKAQDYFAQIAQKAIEDAWTGDCDTLRSSLKTEYERIGISECEDEYQKTIVRINEIKTERIARAREKMKKELTQIEKLEKKRMYKTAGELFDKLIPKITELELKKEIEGKKRLNDLYVAAKKGILKFINNKNGIEVFGLGYLKSAKEDNVVLQIEDQSMPIGWDKIRDNEFLVLLQKAITNYQGAELYAAYAVLLLKKGDAEEAGHYLEKALASSSTMSEKYPELFAEAKKRIAEKKAAQASRVQREPEKQKVVSERIISSEALLTLDGRAKDSWMINFSPGSGTIAQVNPPRFRWMYVPTPQKVSGFQSLNAFQFQIAVDPGFSSKLVNVRCDYNFYNELAPLPEGKTYYWRVGYMPINGRSPSPWSKVRSFHIPKGTPKWDRSMLKDPPFTEHPRVLFTPQMLARLKKTAPSHGTFTRMRSVAQQMRSHKFWNSWPMDDMEVSDWKRSKGEDNKYCWTTCRKLMQTAFVYLITNDKQYSNILEIWTRIAGYKRGGPASMEGFSTWSQTEDNTSITEYIACVYDWFYDKLTPRQRAIFEESLEWRLSAWFYEFRWAGTFCQGGPKNPTVRAGSLYLGGSGHSWEGTMATFPASIALYDKSELARKFFHTVANYIIAVGEKIAQNGVYDLGAHYGTSHMKWLTYSIMYLNGGMPNLQLGKNPLYRQYGEYFIAQAPIGIPYSHFGRLAQQGGFWGMRHEVMKLIAYLTNDGVILDNWNKSGGGDYYGWRQWVHVASPVHFAERLKPVAGKKRDFLFASGGFVMAHSGPPSDPSTFKNGAGVIFSCRPFSGDGYMNENSFQFYAYGQSLNYGGHTCDEEPHGYHTMAQNTILIDGIGQSHSNRGKKDGYRGIIMAHRVGRNFVYWMGDATNAYPDIPKTHGRAVERFDENVYGVKDVRHLRMFRRHMLFMHRKYLVIFDDLLTDGKASKFTFLYRVLQKGDATYNPATGRLVYEAGNVTVHLQHVAFPGQIELIHLKDKDGFKNPLTGEDYMKNQRTANYLKDQRWARNLVHHNFWFTTRTPKSRHHFMTVIYPVKGGSPPIIQRLDDYTVRVGSDVISFDRNTRHRVTLVVDLSAMRKPVSFPR